MDANDLIDTLATAQGEAQRRSAWDVLLQQVKLLTVFVIFGLAAMVLLGINWAYGNWRWGWNTFAPVNFWLGIVIGGIFVLVNGITRLVRFKNRAGFAAKNARAQFTEQARTAFLATLAASDDALLPPLPYQPTVGPPPLIQQRRRIAPLSHLALAPKAQQIWRDLAPNGTVLAIIPSIFISPLVAVLRGNAQTPQEFTTTLNIYDQFITYLVLPFVLGYGLFLSATLIKKTPVFISDQGLSWRRFGRWVHMPWTEIRTIGICEDDSPANIMAARYVIASETRLITWGLPLTDITPLPPNRAREWAATEQMLALVMTQTGLPLRDLRPLAQATVQAVDTAFPPASPVADSTGQRRRSARTDGFVQTERPVRPDLTLVAAVAERIAATPAPAQQRTRWGTVALVSGVFLFITLTPQILSDYLHDTYLPRYLATLPAQLKTKPAMLHDALLVPAHGWTQQSPNANNGDTIAYTTNGYTITNGGGMGSAVLPDTYHAVAIQVTMRMNGTAQATDVYKDGVGIIVRQHTASTTDHYYDCRLLITMQGQWGDTCGYDSHSPNGYSTYLHQGTGAVNVLMVIARGQFYSFYLNGHFVGYNYSQEGEPFGQIGLINQTKGSSATFTDFTVWAIKPPPNPFFI